MNETTMLRPYVVRPGDHLSGLAHRFGFTTEDVWNDPKNAELKKKRKSCNILQPGDIVYIPESRMVWHTLTLGVTNTFTVYEPDVHLNLRFIRAGKPASNLQYEVDGADVPPGVTDGDGVARLVVPVTTSCFQLRLIQRNEVYNVRVGHLDPANEPSGAWARLGCLGHVGGTGGDVRGSDDDLADALRGFQRAHDLDATGALDEATVKKLVEAFGS